MLINHAGITPKSNEKKDVIVTKYMVSIEYSINKFSHKYEKLLVSTPKTLYTNEIMGNKTIIKRKKVENINPLLFDRYFFFISNLFCQIYELPHLS